MIVYILNAQGTNLYKIGITSGNLDRRVKNLQTGNPNKIVVISTLETDHASKVERTMHRHYRYCKQVGEWFEFENISIEKVKETLQQINENINFLENERSSY